MSFDFQIKADPAQALDAEKKVVKGLEDIEQASAKAGRAMASNVGKGAADAANSVNVMKSAMTELAAVAGLAFGVHEIVHMADEYAMMSNRLRAVSDDQANLNGLMDATFKIAQDTRSSWEDIANVYNRVQQSGQGLGASQAQLLEVTKTLSMATKISGASAQEASMSMMELTHAFAIGHLTGREFRVLAKDMPVLITAMAQAAGKTRSEFVEMGMRGHITSKMLLEDLGKAAPEIARQFNQSMPTISGSLTMVHNAATKFFGETAVGTGIMQRLTGAIQYVARHFEDIGRAVSVVIDLMGTMIDVVGTVVEGWSKLLGVFGDGLPTEGIEMSLKNVINMFAAFVLAVKAIITHAKDLVVIVFGAIPMALAEQFDNAFRDVVNYAVGIVNKLIEAINKMANIGTNLRGMAALPGYLGDKKDSKRAHADAAEAGQKEAYLNQAIIDAQNGQGDLPFGMSIEQATKLRDSARADREAAVAKARPYDQAVKEAEGKYGPDAEIKPIGEIGPSDVNEVRAALKGSTENAKRKMAEVGEDIKRDIVLGLSELNKASVKDSYVKKSGGKPDPVGATKEQEAAYEKLKNQLRSVMEQSNPVVAAQEKLAQAEEITTKAVGAGMITWTQAAQIMDDYERKLHDALHPYDAMVTKLLQANAAMRGNADEQERATQMQALENEAKQKGIELTENQRHYLERILVLNQSNRKEMAEQQAQYAAIVGPTEKYALELKALHSLWDDGTISQEQYNRALDKSRLAYLDASGEARTFAGGVEKALLQIKDEATDVGSAIGKVFVDAFHSIENALTDLIVKGTTDWKQLVEGIETDMVRLLLRQGENAILGIGGDKGGDATTAAMVAGGAAAGGEIATAMAAAGLAAGASIAAAMTAGGASAGIAQGGLKALTDAGMLGGLDAYATGGGFVVGGNGGTDSQVVAFRATPGEKVTVQNPSQSRGSTQQGSTARPIVNNHIHLDPKELLRRVAGTPEFEEVVSNIAVRAVGPAVALRSRNGG